jgi:glycosyltransferase involved in cell wall biosynthesis
VGTAWLEPLLRKVPIGFEKRRHYPGFPMLRRVVGRVATPRFGHVFNHRLEQFYDARVARGVTGLQPDVAVCYENAALRTFKKAKAVGAVCVLDAAAVHYESAQRWRAADPVWVDTQKREEISLADAILTCSDFAADTYRAAGVPPEKLYSVPLGADLPRVPFSPRARGEACRFVFVGALRRVKAVDILLDIFGLLARDGIAAELTLIGGAPEPDLRDKARTMANATYLPFRPQPDLFAEIARHDVLLLPSRFDSFGMVVAEAMAVGVPALVSNRVGAKCIIEAHPDSGWVVPCDMDAIRNKILELVGDRDRIARAAIAARRAAEDFTWTKYRSRVTATIEHIYSQHRVRA